MTERKPRPKQHSIMVTEEFFCNVVSLVTMINDFMECDEQFEINYNKETKQMRDALLKDLRTDVMKMSRKVENQADLKLRKIRERSLYSKSKSQDAPILEREEAKEKYLDEKGVHKDWRY